MSTDQDTARIVRSWLRTDEHESADRILGDVLALLDATPQHRPWAVRRIAPMNPLAKLIAATAAVVVVAVVGVNLLGNGITGPGGFTPKPSAPSPSPSVSAVVPNAPIKGPLDAGTYRISEAFQTGHSFTFTVPDGWRRSDNFVYPSDNDDVEAYAFDGDGVFMATWVVSHVYRDSCQWEGSLVRTRTAQEIVEALTQQTGHATSSPVATTLGGHPATRLELSLAADADLAACDEQLARLWPDPGPIEVYGLPVFPGQMETAYVVDLESGPTLIIAGQKDSSSAADITVLEQVVASIEFE